MPIDSFTYDSFTVSQSGYSGDFPVMEGPDLSLSILFESLPPFGRFVGTNLIRIIKSGVFPVSVRYLALVSNHTLSPVRPGDTGYGSILPLEGTPDIHEDCVRCTPYDSGSLRRDFEMVRFHLTAITRLRRFESSHTHTYAHMRLKSI